MRVQSEKYRGVRGFKIYGKSVMEMRSPLIAAFDALLLILFLEPD